jgi:hypothetical protein
MFTEEAKYDTIFIGSIRIHKLHRIKIYIVYKTVMKGETYVSRT